ncbi:hypothetical protein E2C01_081818 [Portunus trituberculatus]|uniref:Dipeptidase n=1 Tax=Portunus trituberculatus TaxID=210409 RepID=A0A5B7IXM5_PORTR|nr:hypothetical protein [Portunus trituberculatus]
MEDLRKLAGQNLLRVMREAEQVRKDLQEQGMRPYEEELPHGALGETPSCFYKFNKSPSNSE